MKYLQHLKYSQLPHESQVLSALISLFVRELSPITQVNQQSHLSIYILSLKY